MMMVMVMAKEKEPKIQKHKRMGDGHVVYFPTSSLFTLEIKKDQGNGVSGFAGRKGVKFPNIIPFLLLSWLCHITPRKSFFF